MNNNGPTTQHLTILIVDDEVNIRKTLTFCLRAEGHQVLAVSNGRDALTEAKLRVIDLTFLDLRLPNENGLEVLPLLLADSPWMKVVVITAYASVETAVEAMRRGAFDYLPKPFSPDQIRMMTRKIAQVRTLELQVESLKATVNRFNPEARMASRNPELHKMIGTMHTAASSDATILLRGESGTGKTVFASAIHAWSLRAAKPLAIVSCPALPAQLLESELFGHTRGAFTDAVRDHPGRITSCEGGTLVLDEIADLAPSTQAKLLRFIQDREYERLGESSSRKADVRIISATNADLEARVADGRFREDLFYRLNVISFSIPPLREHPEDILALATDFLQFFAAANHKRLQGFSAEALEYLHSHPWPGNIRELRNAIERAVILSTGTIIDQTDLPMQALHAHHGPILGAHLTLAGVEEHHIRRVLAGASSLQEAAEVLGIDLATLWRRRKLYGLLNSEQS